MLRNGSGCKKTVKRCATLCSYHYIPTVENETKRLEKLKNLFQNEKEYMKRYSHHTNIKIIEAFLQKEKTKKRPTIPLPKIPTLNIPLPKIPKCH